LILLLQPGISVSINHLILGFFLALIISVIAFRIRFLTLSGGVATFLLAFLIFSLGGWQWTFPVLSFFIFSSFLSKLREKKNPSVNNYFAKSGTRDFYQVLANGGLGGILVFINQIFPNAVWFYTYSGIIASSCADTWATEIGTMARHRTYDILRFRRVEQGSSGGVSLIGFGGSLCGALFISLISVLYVENNKIDFVLLVTIAGFAAALFDSFLGASLQAQYKCPVCEKIVDNKIHCSNNAVKFRGIKFLNNDLVNLAAGLFGGITVLSFYGY
jgi:uncharacterized protein (TIGR00297 family)